MKSGGARLICYSSSCREMSVLIETRSRRFRQWRTVSQNILPSQSRHPS